MDELVNAFWQFWLPLLAGGVGMALGYMWAHDYLEVRRLMKLLHGDTRQSTLRRLRAHIEVMRQEYALKPGDRFTLEMLATCDRLEETMDRLDREEWLTVR